MEDLPLAETDDEAEWHACATSCCMSEQCDLEKWLMRRMVCMLAISVLGSSSTLFQVSVSHYLEFTSKTRFRIRLCILEATLKATLSAAKAVPTQMIVRSRSGGSRRYTRDGRCMMGYRGAKCLDSQVEL